LMDLLEVKTENIHESKSFDSKVLPLTLVPGKPCDSLEPFLNWLRVHGQKGSKTGTEHSIEHLLIDHTAILFRGFGVKTPEDFAECVKAVGYENFPYIGGNAVRRNVVGNIVFTANEAPGHISIPFHHEMAQVPVFPSKLYFYCSNPPDTDGQTPLLHSHMVYETMAKLYPEFMDQIEQKGVIYSRIMTAHDRPESPLGRGWKSTYAVNTKEELEAKLREKGYSWEWRDGEILREITPVLRAVKVDERTGKKQFFNQIIAAYTGWKDEYNVPEKAITVGDQSPLNLEFMQKLVELSQTEKVVFKWQQGDILIIDNITVMHARSSFTGDRRILASLAK